MFNTHKALVKQLLRVLFGYRLSLLWNPQTPLFSDHPVLDQ
jgi:hypothetical protein